MAKVMVYPPNSMILSDLVERMGHKALVITGEIRKKVTSPGLDSPPLNLTPEDPKIGLKYAAVDVPSGVRGRMALLGPMVEEADAAIIINNATYSFGCSGCERTSELTKFLLRTKGIPVLELRYPSDDGEGRRFVYEIRKFLEALS